MELTNGAAFEMLFEQLLENLTDGIFLVGYDGHIRMENNVASHILDFGDEALAGKTIVDLISENSKNDAFFECITLAVFKKEKINDLVPYFRQDGERLLRLSVSPLRDREENIAALVTFSDVTELTDLGRKNEELNKKILDFLDRFVQVLIGAIDKRSHFNATHTKKMVAYITKYLDYLEREGRGVDPNKKGPILSSVWMHDVGKLVIPLNILEKPNRLAEKIKEVRHRAEVSIMHERIIIAACTGVSDENADIGKDEDGLLDVLSESTEWINLEESARRLAKSDKLSDLAKEAQERIKELEDALRFVEDVNDRGFIDEETQKRIEDISKIQCHTFSGEYIDFLDDYDVEALTVQKGNLTQAERQVVNSHVVETREILTALGFEGPFKDVPEWAGNHHEYLDGSGYPKGISGEQISWEARLLTIVDIYDALTAEDRPYKPPIPEDRAFDILRGMADDGKIDGDILKDFYESGAWKR